MPHRDLQTHLAGALRCEIHHRPLSLGYIFLWVWRDNSAWGWVPEPRTDPEAEAPCPAGARA